ncbi:MAG: (2Fe-2S)-binding protein [Clostridiaceae bacterium]|nr:(2Fe-2S)-binding protein [Eubacteriales bacterium]
MFSITQPTRVTLHVNGEARSAVIGPSETLLDALRYRLGLTGAKAGCENGDCGACTVLLNGRPVKACLMLAAEATDCDILTVEGLKNAPAQRAFVEQNAFQCGYCTSGFLMVCHAMQRNLNSPTDAEFEAWLQSNLCRCTSYEEIGLAARGILEGKYGEG